MAEKRLNYCAWPALTGFAIFAILAVASNPVKADQDVLPDFFGNTLVSKDGDFETHYYYSPDHTFTAKLPAYYLVLNNNLCVLCKDRTNAFTSSFPRRHFFHRNALCERRA
jgi:hypothetical protein